MERGSCLAANAHTQGFFKRANVLLLCLCILASVMGLVLIYSATQYRKVLQDFAVKQAMFLCMGIVAYIWGTFIDIEFLMEKWWWVFLLLGLFVIALIKPFGRLPAATRAGCFSPSSGNTSASSPGRSQSWLISWCWPG